jgi:23S rRNA (pseudouridine1915-N3)-methyltransferase
MKARIIAVGKIKKRWIADGIQEYLKRVPELGIVEVRDAGQEKEAEKIMASLHPGERLILLSERGKGMDSVEFSRFIERQGMTPLAFVIGGPEGFSDRLLPLAHSIMSLSPMTFTHEMARLFLVEQLYRAKSILNNTSYHK